MNIINLKCKWMMVASKRLGNVGALLDFIHLTHLAEPPVETHTLFCGEIFHPRKGTRKTRASLKSCLIFGFTRILLRRKPDLEGPMFVRHGQRQDHLAYKFHAGIKKSLSIYSLQYVNMFVKHLKSQHLVWVDLLTSGFLKIFQGCPTDQRWHHI